MLRIPELALPLNYTDADLQKAAAKKIKADPKEIQSLRLVRRAVDARKKSDLRFVCTVDVTLPGKAEARVLRSDKSGKIKATPDERYTLPACKPLEKRPVVVGFGPAGMFAALILAQAGQRPIVLERGKNVDDRAKDVQRLQLMGVLDTESNVQFGEGGAGTFSDGKLNTGTKDPRIHKVFEELVAAGAPKEILVEAKPHVGTDKLPGTVKNVRKTIEKLGGEVRFSACMTGLETRDGIVRGVRFTQNGCEEKLEADHVVLAVGHSARDTFAMLHAMGLPMEAKPFSVGARIEHPQELIDRARYGQFAGHPALHAADYKLFTHLPNGRGVYTFCMCPGGTVVAAASEEGRVVTNGMSRFARDGRNANAALLVSVEPADFGGDSPLAGVEFQRKIEERAFLAAGGGYRAPAQRSGDFLAKQKGALEGTVRPTYLPGVTPCAMEEILPDYVCESMREGIRRFGRQLPGYDSPDAVLTAPETRSSSPVRLLRGETLQSVGLAGLYPCGEGAGFAGGIVSAAVDGIRCAEMILLDSTMR
ncbi:MAG: hypothetical protein IKU17_10295 [Clostridia bacterium]|nr:hypothetical protein [Clostridia bacterium]